MCNQCFQTFCPSDCPNFSGNERRKPAVCCVSCGEPLQKGERFYRINGFPYCEICLDNAETDELVRICEIPKREWLERLGFSLEQVSEEDA